MSAALLEELKTEIDERQQELNATLLSLEKIASRQYNWAKFIRIAIIFLGAFAATKAAADQLLAGGNPVYGTILYSFIGLLIATLGGVEASFWFQKKATDLRTLAADCNSRILDIDCKIPQDAESQVEDRLESVWEILELQNKSLKEIQSRAAEIGVNITRNARKMKPSAELIPAKNESKQLNKPRIFPAAN